MSSPIAPVHKSLKRRLIPEVEIPTRRRPTNGSMRTPSSAPAPTATPTTPSPAKVSDGDGDEEEEDLIVHRPTKRVKLSMVRTPSITPTSTKTKRDKGKARAVNRRSRSRSTTSSRHARSWTCSSTATIKREKAGSVGSILSDVEGIRSVDPRAGPSGTSNEVHRSPTLDTQTFANDLGALDILAAAAEFLNDADGLLEFSSDGCLVPHSDANGVIGDKDVKPKLELPELVYPAKAVDEDEEAVERNVRDGSADEVCCGICYSDILEVLRGAEEAGRGGIGGGLALWACEQTNCGALFCIGCAVDWANREIDHGRPSKCPHCTRPTDIPALRAQAIAYDPTGPTDPIHPVPNPLVVEPVLQVQARVFRWLNQFNGDPEHDALDDDQQGVQTWLDWFYGQAFPGVEIRRDNAGMRRVGELAVVVFRAQRRARRNAARAVDNHGVGAPVAALGAAAEEILGPLGNRRQGLANRRAAREQRARAVVLETLHRRFLDVVARLPPEAQVQHDQQARQGTTNDIADRRATRARTTVRWLVQIRVPGDLTPEDVAGLVHVINRDELDVEQLIADRRFVGICQQHGEILQTVARWVGRHRRGDGNAAVPGRRANRRAGAIAAREEAVIRLQAAAARLRAAAVPAIVPGGGDRAGDAAGDAAAAEPIGDAPQPIEKRRRRGRANRVRFAVQNVQ